MSQNVCAKGHLTSEGGFRILIGVEANLALNSDAPKSGAPVTFNVRVRRENRQGVKE
jgi:hypothetical protein